MINFNKMIHITNVNLSYIFRFLLNNTMINNNNINTNINNKINTKINSIIYIYIKKIIKSICVYNIYKLSVYIMKYII